MAYQSEIEKLEQRYEENPKQWFAALADAYRKEGSIDLALEYVRGGLEMRPNYASGYIVLGRCLVEKNEHAAAAQAFEQVLEIDAENIIALQSLSEIAELRGDIIGARNWLERLLEVDPMNETARDTLERLRQVPAEPVAEPSAEEERPEVSEQRGEEPAAAPRSTEPGAAWAAEALGRASPEPEPVAEPPEPQPLELEPTAPPVTEPVTTEPFEPVELERDEEPLIVEREEEPFGVEPAAGEPFQVTKSEEGPGFGISLEDEEAASAAPAPGPAEGIGDDRPVVPDASAPLGAAEPEEPPVAAFGDVAPPEPEQVAEPLAAEFGETPGEAEEIPVQHLDVSSFDDELAWDTGDRLSREISQDDIAEAERLHEEVAPAVEFLPGAGGEEKSGESETVPGELLESGGGVEEGAVPVVDEAERDTVEEAADFGALQAVPLLSEEEIERASAAEPPEPAGAAEVEPATAPRLEEEAPPETMGPPDSLGTEGVAPTVDEEVVTAAEPGEPAAAAGAEETAAGFEAPDEAGDLPLIMPEDVTPREPEQEEAVPGSPEPEPVVTETMAEVYAQQGLLEQARDTYEQLVTERPGDPTLQARLNELKERARAVARQSPLSRYSASRTGGLSAVTYLKQVFAGEATEDLGSLETPAGPSPEESSPTKSPLESAFGQETGEAEAPGSPTVPAPDEVSLSSVFGEAPPPQPRADARPTESAAPQPGGGVSFDEFYGKVKDQGSDEAEAAGPSEGGSGEGSDEEFRDWLEGLKT